MPPLTGNDQRLRRGQRPVFHLHIARPNGRVVPAPGDDPAMYAPFVRAVKASGYDGLLSVEAGIPAGADERRVVADGLNALRSLF